MIWTDFSYVEERFCILTNQHLSRKSLLPFIHIGPLSIPTFGLLMWLAFVVAYFVLRAEVQRQKLQVDPQSVILWMVLAGILGAKLWHVMDTPADRPTWEILTSRGIFSWFQSGFAWFGGFTAGIAALLYLGHKYRVGMLKMLDICSPAVAIGYGVGRIGCLISGDGDYGRPTSWPWPWGMSFPHGLVSTTETCVQWGWPADCRVYPTPIYEFIAGALIFWYLWRRGKRGLQHPLATGVITGEFLVLFGLERFLVEFIRINPRVVFGMSNAQFSGLLTAIAGIVLLIFARRRFRKKDPVQRVFEHVSQHGNDPKSEYHRATPECPHPERWRMFDTMTAEVEVLDFLKCLMTTVKPNVVVETGTFMGVSTVYMADGIRQNGFGKIVTCEPDAAIFAKAKEKIDGAGLQKWVDYRCEPSLKLKVSGTIDVLFCDSLPELREPEVRYFLPQINPNGLILMHDASSHLKTVREAALRMEQEGLISVVLLPTPRGLVVAQKREGRK